MRILSITAGAAGMYCGSCFRDNALAAELLTRGHEVTLIPVYTPTRTDEPNVSRRRVLFGGISVYLQQHSTLFRRLPRGLDRVWDAPSVIKAFTNRSVSTDPKLLGDLTISMLEGRDGVLRREFDKLLEWMRDEPAPDVVNLPNSLLISMAAPLRDALRRPICCTLQGEELFLDGLQPSYRDRAIDLIRAQVPHVDRFIAVSDYCARFMVALLGIPDRQMSVVPLGINVSGYGMRHDRRELFRVGYFARIAPEKGLHVLADAYVRFRRRAPRAQARLDVAGYLSSAHAGYLNDVRNELERAGFGSELSYRGELDRAGKIAFLRDLDVLSVPATYDEPKGMFLLEAMACGVPVVQPRRGAFVEIVERTGGGVLVRPDDADAIAEAFDELCHDRARVAELGAHGFDAVRARYTVARSADHLLDVYRTVVGEAALAQGHRPVPAA